MEDMKEREETKANRKEEENETRRQKMIYFAAKEISEDRMCQK